MSLSLVVGAFAEAEGNVVRTFAEKSECSISTEDEARATKISAIEGTRPVSTGIKACLTTNGQKNHIHACLTTRNIAYANSEVQLPTGSRGDHKWPTVKVLLTINSQTVGICIK